MMRYQIEPSPSPGSPGGVARLSANDADVFATRFLNPLLLPVLLLLLCGTLFICLDARFETQLAADEVRYAELQKTMQAAEYLAMHRAAVTTLARQAIDHDRRTARVLLCVGFIFLCISLISIGVAWKHLTEDPPVQRPD